MAVSSPRTVKYKPFAKRLETAVLNHPDAPDGHGRQVWLRTRLEEKFNFSITPEGVRRWFAGESRPRPDVMKLIAAALEVDEAWLSLGLSQGRTKREDKSHSVSASGAVNYVAGLIQLNGGQIAFNDSEDDDLPFDFFAIVKGRRYNVKVGVPTFGADGGRVIHIPADHQGSLLLGLLPSSDPLAYSLIRIPQQAVEAAGRPREGHVELRLEATDTGASANGIELPAITSFDDLSGERATTDGAQTTPRQRARRAMDLPDRDE